MAKYSAEFKVKIVKEYLEGNLSSKLLTDKHDISDHSLILTWTRVFEAFGEEGLRRKQTKQSYPVHFKLDVLHFMKQSGASYRDTAIQFKINSPGLIARWNGILLKDGIDGLKDKPKGRPSMNKRQASKVKNNLETMSREEQLKRENELLHLEVAYLKKLKAFQENPDTFLEKHKQRWHTNSKKQDSN